jgi:hypothetical protein
MIGGERLSL